MRLTPFASFVFSAKVRPMSLEIELYKMMFKQTASPLMSELDKFDNEFSPCDFILGCTLPFWKEFAALVTCDLVTSIVECLSDLGYIKITAAISTMIIGQNFCSCFWLQLENKVFYYFYLSYFKNASAASWTSSSRFSWIWRFVVCAISCSTVVIFLFASQVSVSFECKGFRQS